jgi:hypothetical protein
MSVGLLAGYTVYIPVLAIVLKVTYGRVGGDMFSSRLQLPFQIPFLFNDEFRTLIQFSLNSPFRESPPEDALLRVVGFSLLVLGAIVAVNVRPPENKIDSLRLE